MQPTPTYECTVVDTSPPPASNSPPTTSPATPHPTSSPPWSYRRPAHAHTGPGGLPPIWSDVGAIRRPPAALPGVRQRVSGRARHSDASRSLLRIASSDPLQVRWDRDAEWWFAFVLVACAAVCFNRPAYRPLVASTLPPLGNGEAGPASVDTLVQRAIHRIILAALAAASVPGRSRPARYRLSEVASPSDLSTKAALRRSGSSMSSSRSSEQLPLTGNSAKPNRTERAESEVGARDEVSNGSRDDDLAIAGLTKGPSRDVNADPSDVVVAELDLTGVDRRTDRKPEVAEASIEAEGTSKSPRGRVEGGEDAVPGRLHEAAAEAFDLRARQSVMSIEEPAPSLIAERGCLLGRPDDVGEQHGRKDAIGVLRRLPRSQLLLIPGKRLHVLARWDPVRWPVRENGDSGLEGPAVGELQVRDVRRVAEETLATSKHHGKHHEAILVDHVMLDERVEKVGAAEEQDVTARLLLQLGDLLGGVSPDDD